MLFVWTEVERNGLDLVVKRRVVEADAFKMVLVRLMQRILGTMYLAGWNMQFSLQD